MYCKNCGKEIGNGVAYCPVCGVSTGTATQQAAASQPVVNIINTVPGYIHKKKWTAFWLCFFLGGLGVHRFYVGKTGTGILWLLSAGLFGIGWLIDLIVILCGGFKDKAGQSLI